MIKSKKGKNVISLTLILISAFAMIYILFNSTDDIFQLYSVIKNIKIRYLLIAILSIFIFWLLESYMIYVLITKFTEKKKILKTFWLALKATMIGQYYSNITPFASGGQPVQLYIMLDDDVPASSGTAVLVTKFLLFQIGVTIYSLLLAIYRINLLISYSNGVSFFIITGLTLNVFMISGIVLIAFKPKIIIKLAESLLNFLYRHHIIKNVETKIIKLHKFISDYEISISKLKKNVWLTIRMFFITIVQLTVFFSITFFIYKALNLSGTSIFDVICLQAFLYMSVSFIPTPGTVGVSEVGFMLLLNQIFPANLIGTALILWRGISYYFSLIFSGLFSLIVTTLCNKKAFLY